MNTATTKTASIEELTERVRRGYNTTSTTLKRRHTTAWFELVRRGFTDDQIIAAI